MCQTEKKSEIQKQVYVQERIARVVLTHVFEFGDERLVVDDTAHCKKLFWVRALLDGGRRKRRADGQHACQPLRPMH